MCHLHGTTMDVKDELQLVLQYIGDIIDEQNQEDMNELWEWINRILGEFA